MLADKSSGALGLNLQTLTLVTVTVVTVLLFRDPKLRNLFRVDYFSRHGRWAEVIEIGRRSPYHYLICHAVNRALCQTGRFGDEMFRFPQRPSALLLTGKEAPWQKFDTCLEMGLVNQAENAMTISLEMYGERPLLLQRLATVSMAKGNVRAAGVFLRALEKVPFWRSKARQYLAQLKNDPELLQDDEIQQLRRVMLKTDYVGGADTLTLLLTENPRNRVAYEYGMASLLLSKNLDDFVKIFNRYHRLNATRIPRHYEEALLLSRVLKRQPIDVPGQKIAAQTKTQLHEFLQAVQRGGKDKSTTKSALKQALRAEFGTTYFYYYFFGS